MNRRNPMCLYMSHNEVDYRNRTFRDILAWDDETLERTHDYIQVLFPSTQPSRAVPNSPVLTEDEVDQVLLNPTVLNQVQEGLRESLRRMLAFYGLMLCERRGPDENTFIFAVSSGYGDWRREGNHNARRIARIIYCLQTFGLDHIASAFTEYLKQTLPTHSSGRFWGY